MLNSFKQFQNSLKYTKELDALYVHLKYVQLLPNDLTDLLRTQISFSVSALDKLIHDLIRVGMIESFKELRPRTSKYRSFNISLDTFSKINTSVLGDLTVPILQLPEFWFEQEIILRHKILSFQDPDKISDGLSLIWDESHKWQVVALAMQQDQNSLKIFLKNIVLRRNQIVHEADYDVLTGARNSISEQDTRDSVSFIERLGEELYNLVKLPLMAT